MKKIITAAAIAAMAAGFATAEVKVSLNYRAGIDVAQHEINDNTGDSHGTTFFSNQSGIRKNSDALTFKGSAEYGGVELEIDPTLSGKATESKNNNVTLEKYNGWINFGNFTIKSGAWDKLAVGRVNGSAGNHESAYFGELLKPGLADGLGTKGNGINISQQSDKNMTTMVEYNNKDLGFEARVAYRDNDGVKTTFAGQNYGDKADEEDDYKFANSLWFGELGYTVKGVGRIMGTTKLMHNDYAFAAFFEPKLDNAKALTSLIGFTVETNRKGYKDSNGDWNTLNAYGLDLRACYDLKDAGVPLAITFMYNWTFGEKAKNSGSDDRVYGTFASWGMVNFKYTLNETFSPFFSAIYTTGNTWSHAKDNATSSKLAYYKPATSALKFDDPYNFSLRLYGGVEIYNTANANLIMGICYDASNMMERDVTYSSKDGNNSTGVHAAGVKAISIPVLLRVKF